MPLGSPFKSYKGTIFIFDYNGRFSMKNLDLRFRICNEVSKSNLQFHSHPTLLRSLFIFPLFYVFILIFFPLIFVTFLHTFVCVCVLFVIYLNFETLRSNAHRLSDMKIQANTCIHMYTYIRIYNQNCRVFCM